MLPIDFEEANQVYTKPDNMTDEQCMDLPVWQGFLRYDDSLKAFPSIVSCWRLSKEDLEEIQRTGVIWLSVNAVRMPPVCVMAVKPPMTT